MIFNLATHVSWFLLASTALASPTNLVRRDDKVIIVHRTCSEVLKVQRSDTFDNPNTQHQLGYGLYTSPAPGEYMGDKSGNWICVIYMEEDFFKDIPKAWIPEKYKGQVLWERPEDTILDYVAHGSGVGGDEAPSALRISIFPHDGKEDLQLLIPTDLANAHDGEITAKCAATKEGLPIQKTVNYDDWDDVKGHKTDPGNSDSDSEKDD
ncbi:hypothetical protein F5X99DRAFT_422146 [Biscogniauxia marginata]|nr:hypothetical protein F5X99DRAFT_422146 [Biscogniauxia marginata]